MGPGGFQHGSNRGDDVRVRLNGGGTPLRCHHLYPVPRGHRVEKLAVEVGTLLGDHVIVRGELEVGDLVVVGGQRGLLDGESVEVLR